MEWVTIGAFIVAAYGAGLSTYNAVVARHAGRRHVKVTLRITATTRTGSKLLLAVTAANPGNRSVTLTDSWIALSIRGGARTMPLDFLSPGSYPYELKEGQNCMTCMDLNALTGELLSKGLSGKIRLVGCWRDAVGTVYKSKPLRYDLDDWGKNLHGSSKENSVPLPP